MGKLYFVLAILLTFSFTAKAEENLPPVEFGTDPYKFDYGKLRGDDPYEKPVQQVVQPEPAPMQRQFTPQAPEVAMEKHAQEANAVNLQAKHKFALIVPLTGKGADIGKAMRDAALLALAEKGSPDYAIIPIDINIDGGEAAAKQAVSYGVEAILGPIFSDQVGKVAKVARAAKIKVISFSNNKQVAGGGVYILGLVPDQQVERVLLFAGNKGIRNYSAIVPNNAYGAGVSEMVRKYAGWIGGNLRDIGLYSATTKPSTAAGVIAEAYKAKGAKPSLSKDAVVIPEGGDKLRSLVSALSNVGLSCGRVRCLGVASWDDKSVISSGALNGAWYAASPYEDVEDFLIRFQQKFGYMPDEIASLGYDAASLAVEVAPGFSSSALEKRSGFKGIKGIYRFIGDGSNQRGYAIYEINHGNAQVIDGAPNRF